MTHICKKYLVVLLLLNSRLSYVRFNIKPIFPAARQQGLLLGFYNPANHKDNLLDLIVVELTRETHVPSNFC